MSRVNRRRIETDYQKEQREYTRELMRDFYKDVYSTLKSALEEAGLYRFFISLLDYISYDINSITETSLGNKEDDLTFYVSYDGLRKSFYGTKKMSDRQILNNLQFLCDVGMLVRLEDNLYMLIDLAPSVEREAIMKIVDKKY